MANTRQLLWNAAEFIEKWQQFIAAPAGTVTLEYYDRSGVLRTARFDNRAKLVQNFIQNVNQVMDKTIYVDPIEGNDENDGSSDAPVKTLYKAVEIIPPGGVGEIILRGDISIQRNIYLNGRKLLIRRELLPATKDENNPWISHQIIDEENGYTSGFSPYRGGAIFFFGVNIRTVSSSNPLGIWEGFIKRADNAYCIVTFFNSIIEVNSSSLVRIAAGPTGLTEISLYGTDVRRLSDAYPVFNEGNSPICLKIGTTTFTDGSGNSLTWDNFVKNILRDSNGAPLNVIANISI